MLNVKHHAGSAVVRELRERLLRELRAHEPLLRDLLDGGALGWVVRERIMNLPYELGAPLFLCLQEDVKWAWSHAADFDDEGDYDFEHYLLLAPCYPPAPEHVSAAAGAAAASAARRARSGSLSEFVEYVYPEDFVFARHAAHAFTWGLARPPPRSDVDEPPETGSKPWFVRVMVIPKAGFAAAVQQVSSSSAVARP